MMRGSFSTIFPEGLGNARTNTVMSWESLHARRGGAASRQWLEQSLFLRSRSVNSHRQPCDEDDAPSDEWHRRHDHHDPNHTEDEHVHSEQQEQD